MAATGYEMPSHSHALNDPGHSMGRNYVGDGSVGIAPKLVTPVERVADTLSEARALSGRVRSIVNNLIGCLPESEAKDGGSGVTGGIITDLAVNAEYAFTELRRANDELSRLSKVLGLGL